MGEQRSAGAILVTPTLVAGSDVAVTLLPCDEPVAFGLRVFAAMSRAKCRPIYPLPKKLRHGRAAGELVMLRGLDAEKFEDVLVYSVFLNCVRAHHDGVVWTLGAPGSLDGGRAVYGAVSGRVVACIGEVREASDDV